MPNVYKGQNTGADSVTITNVALTGDFSFCFKAKFASVISTDSFGLASSAADDSIRMGFGSSAFIVRYKNAGLSEVILSAITAGLVTVDTWHTFILTRNNATGELNVYVDNTLGPTIIDATNGKGTFDFDRLFIRAGGFDPWEGK